MGRERARRGREGGREEERKEEERKGAKMTAIHRTEYQRKETCIKRAFHRSSEVPFQQSEYQHRHVKKLRCGNNARKK